MFETGTYIICGQHGVCRVEAVGPIKLSEASKNRIYYTLSQVGTRDGVIYVPADSEKITMRQVINRQAAENLIEGIDEIETLWIEHEKKREETFKNALRTCDYRDWVKVIKTIYQRKESRILQGKKVTVSDERYLHVAEENLYGELAIALGMKKEEIEQYIIDKMKEKQELNA